VPERPPFVPANWGGSIGKLPYPEYPSVQTLKEPQTWPEPGDLTKPWSFDGKEFQP
jgi:sulfonate transport system substrate-binding protein